MNGRIFAVALALATAVRSLGSSGGLLDPQPPFLLSPLPGTDQISIPFVPGDAVVEYQMEFAPLLNAPFTLISSGGFVGTTWTNSVPFGTTGFYRLNAQVVGTNELAGVTLLNRIAYGPTPDELDRVKQMGPDAYIAEQLAPETIAEDFDTLPTPDGAWRQISITGPGPGSSLQIYLEGLGDAFLDDIRLVAGAKDDGTQPNLIKNGGFESALQGTWTLTTNYIASARSANSVHSGTACLHLVAGTGNNGGANSILQTISPALNGTNVYTLSFWYLPSSESVRLDVRTSGNGPGVSVALNDPLDRPAGYMTALTTDDATIDQLRGWHLRHAIQSKRQLLEIMRQFWENHFVTEYSKSSDYMGGLLPTAQGTPQAVDFEFRENLAWRNAMLKPVSTFYDLLKISAESPAMIIYLDTVLSRGDVAGGQQNVANENFARELCELFTLGVDNGYDQGDIVQISRAWTGWRVDLLAPGSQNNPFSGRSTIDKPGVTTNFSALTNLLGTWSFRYIPARHDNRVKYVFFTKDSNGNIVTNQPKLVPDRFGPPWARQPYGLVLNNGSGTNGIQDGYSLIQHLANLPFTEEFLSVKLCRLFVHENFQIGYDFTDATTSPEEDLVHACMLAWESPPNGGPKGQWRVVLKTIFDSDLFRSYAASNAKVKTPLEFIASTVRALRAMKPDGSYTASTDTGSDYLAALGRMGVMGLFNRAEPNGYPEDGAAWVSAGTLSDRIRFVESALMSPAMTARVTEAGLNTRLDPSALLALKIPQQMTDPSAVASYFLGILFPAEGAANLSAYRTAAISYLNSGLDGKGTVPFSKLSPNQAEYDARVRGMVALLLGSQRFQEQ